MAFKDLVSIAQKTVAPKDITNWISAGSVAAALLTINENVYRGVCIDTACSLGFCAKHSAIAAMITNREYKIKKIVAVNSEGEPIPPCGRCRELLSQLCEHPKEIEVMIAFDTVVTLDLLLPNDWKTIVN